MRHWFLLPALLFVAACSSTVFQDKSRVPADAPAYIKGSDKFPGVKIGKPYVIAGKRYYPEYDPDYSEVGLASWYGPNFHGKPTANGERFNQWAMTAAHTTLPLPSMVRVTRIDNGQSIIVRVNDRGPFADGRIIDLSRAAAEALGTDRMGLAKVRVDYLPEETAEFLQKIDKNKPASMLAKSSKSDKSSFVTFSEPESVMPDPVQMAEVGFVETDSLPPLKTKTTDAAPAPFAEAAPRKKELGYVEDAFSVLDRIDKDHKAKFPKAQPNDPAALKHLRRVQKVDKPIYLQVASFSDKANAMSMAEKLSAISAVEVREVDVKGTSWYRVRLGPTHNQAVAEELKERVAEWGVRDARLVQD